MEKKITIIVAFELGERVEYNSKIGKDDGIVTGYSIRQNNTISYDVSWSNKGASWHYDFELKSK